MKRLLTALTGVVMLVAVACGPDFKLTEGTVIDKSIDPGYTYYINTCVSRNTQGMCTLSIPVPTEVPTRYYLLVEGEHDGKTIRERRRVGANEYSFTADGDHWMKG